MKYTIDIELDFDCNEDMSVDEETKYIKDLIESGAESFNASVNITNERKH